MQRRLWPKKDDRDAREERKSGKGRTRKGWERGRGADEEVRIGSGAEDAGRGARKGRGRTASEGERIRSIKHGGLAHWLRSSWALRAAPSTSGLYALLYTNHPAACSLLPLLPSPPRFIPLSLSLSPSLLPSLRFHLSSGIGNSESRPCCSLRCFPILLPGGYFFSFFPPFLFSPFARDY